MIPVRLKLSGFLSYWDESDLNLEQVDLACISGSNGAGKSSLLDAITWALFGEARRRDDAIINSHCDAAEVTLDFDYEGHRYRILRSKTRGKSARLDFFIRDEESNWKPLTEATMSKTQERIIQTLRLDYETFINASFFLQGKADQFAQQTPGNRKKILSTILGLERWEAFRDTASRMIRDKNNEKAAHAGSLQEIETELGEEDSRQAQLKKVDEDLKKAEELRKAREGTFALARRQADSFENLRKNVEMLSGLVTKSEAQKMGLEQNLSDLEQDRLRYQETIDQAEEIEASLKAWQEARIELEKWDALENTAHQLNTEYSAQKMIVEKERSRLEEEFRTLDEQYKNVVEIKKNIPELENNLRSFGTELKLFETRLSEKPALEAGNRDLREKQGSLSAENKQLKSEMDELAERIQQLKDTAGATCPLCGQPLSDPDRLALISSLENQGKEKGDRYRDNNASRLEVEKKLSECDEALAKLYTVEKERESRLRQFDQVESQLINHRDALSLWMDGKQVHRDEIVDRLKNNDFAPEASKALAEIEKKLKKLGYNPDAHTRAVNEELVLRESQERKNKLDQASAALEPLMRDIQSKHKQLTETLEELKKQQVQYEEANNKFQLEAGQIPDLVILEQELNTAREDENRLRLEVGAAQQNVDVLDDLRHRAEGIHAAMDEITTRITHLRKLEHAFSREGIPALLIEEALPEIESRANDLLDRLSSGAMSMRFETQGEYKDKNREDKKETLDILISDSAGVRPYEMFSGGEAFRVNFAIRLALSHVLAQRAGARLQTLVIDEGFGSQDTEGRQRLIEAINLVRPDFARILVITHLEELKDAFPTRIEVEKTGKGSYVKVSA